MGFIKNTFIALLNDNNELKDEVKRSWPIIIIGAKLLTMLDKGEISIKSNKLVVNNSKQKNKSEFSSEISKNLNKFQSNRIATQILGITYSIPNLLDLMSEIEYKNQKFLGWVYNTRYNIDKSEKIELTKRLKESLLEPESNEYTVLAYLLEQLHILPATIPNNSVSIDSKHEDHKQIISEICNAIAYY